MQCKLPRENAGLSIQSIFTPEQQPCGSAHEKASAQQMHKSAGLYPQKYSMRAAGGMYLGFRTLSRKK